MKPRLRVGVIVEHQSYGTGMVLRFVANGRVDVLFLGGTYRVLPQDLEPR